MWDLTFNRSEPQELCSRASLSHFRCPWPHEVGNRQPQQLSDLPPRSARFEIFFAPTGWGGAAVRDLFPSTRHCVVGIADGQKPSPSVTLIKKKETRNSHRLPRRGSKMRVHSFLTSARLTARLVFLGSRGVRSRKGLEYWYKPEREKPE